MAQLPHDPPARSIARILKVNHAGEYGAIRIYRAQLWMAKRFYPDLVPFLAETLGHEVRHASLFLDAMPARAARPCRIMALWGNGGLVLGFGTALLGRQGIWICTAAVEGTVHRHLEDQLAFLHASDPQLHALIEAIKDEELGHLQHAEDRIVTHAAWARVLHSVVAGATEAVIWLSTWGDSNRMKRDLDASKAPNAKTGDIMPKNYKDVFTPEELAYQRERQKDALEKARSLPELSDEEEAQALAGALSDPDALPLTDEQLSRMRPAHEVLTELVATWLRQKRGRPPTETPKKQVTLRLDQDVVDHFKASRPGWQTRINDGLRTVAKKAAAGR